MSMNRVVFFGLLCAAQSIGSADAGTISEPEPIVIGESGGSDAPVGDVSERQESWIYMRIPRFGVASLQAVLEEGSPANLAWLDVGQPIELYQPVPLLAPTANGNNGAISVRMLPEHCLGDFDWDGSVGWTDAILFTQIFLNGHHAADLTGDGILDIRDHILFLHLATVPCVDAW